MSSISQKDLDKLKSRLEATEAKVKQASQDRAAWTADKAQLDSQVKKLTKSNQMLEKEVPRFFLPIFQLHFSYRITAESAFIVCMYYHSPY